MSYYEESYWDRRNSRQAAYIERITNNVRYFCSKYENILDEIQYQGFDKYIENEYTEIREKIRLIDTLLYSEDVNNVNQARDLSFEIGNVIYGLKHLAKIEKSRIENGNRILKREEQRKRLEINKNARNDFIEQIKLNLEADRSNNPAAVENAVKKLDSFKNQADLLSNDDFIKQLRSETAKTDDEIVDETVRRGAIKAIYLSLKKFGFIIQHPKLEGDVVVLRAQKPAGQQAIFSVKIDGQLTYKFDNYEGQKCRQDIEQVSSLLEECYGIKLSKRKVLWSNPNRIQKGEKDGPLGGDQKSLKH